jgi:hypothetical protein
MKEVVSGQHIIVFWNRTKVTIKLNSKMKTFLERGEKEEGEEVMREEEDRKKKTREREEGRRTKRR